MKLKVCGLNNTKNIKSVVSLRPDFAGFVFYRSSRRYFLKNNLSTGAFKGIPETVKKVGVFVDAPFEEIMKAYHTYQLDYIQLHGNESAAYCARLLENNLSLIKAFSVSEASTFKELEAYEPFCKYFLFDTKGKLPGGNGIKFSWHLLKSYSLEVPFFLSGGIGPDDIDAIQSFHHEKLYGIDINSRFEIEPGIKNVQKIENFKKQLNKINYE